MVSQRAVQYSNQEFSYQSYHICRCCCFLRSIPRSIRSLGAMFDEQLMLDDANLTGELAFQRFTGCLRHSLDAHVVKGLLRRHFDRGTKRCAHIMGGCVLKIKKYQHHVHCAIFRGDRVKFLFLAYLPSPLIRSMHSKGAVSCRH